jgi:hypothetical protein
MPLLESWPITSPDRVGVSMHMMPRIGCASDTRSTYSTVTYSTYMILPTCLPYLTFSFLTSSPLSFVYIYISQHLLSRCACNITRLQSAVLPAESRQSFCYRSWPYRQLLRHTNSTTTQYPSYPLSPDRQNIKPLQITSMYSYVSAPFFVQRVYTYK